MLPKVNQKQIQVIIIRHMGELPQAPDGDKYTFKSASSVDQARGVCHRNGAAKGYFLKNRVYFVPAEPCITEKNKCRCLEHIGDNPACPVHGGKKVPII